MPDWLAPAAENVTDEKTRSVPAFADSSTTLSLEIVDIVGVVAGPAGHRIGARAAIEDVVARIAGQDVGQGIARGVDVRRPGQRDVLDAVLVRPGSGEGHRRIDEICPCIRGQLNDHVAGVVDRIGVIADAPGHGIGAGPAIQRVVAVSTDENIGAAVADEDVVETVARGVDVGRARSA